MTTLEFKTEKSTIVEGKKLESILTDALNEIKVMVIETDYQMNETSQSQLGLFIGMNWEPYLKNLSYNKTKKLNRYIRRFLLKRSRHSANLFFHFLHTRILGNSNEFKKVIINRPLKEQEIQRKRKAWKEVQQMADKLLAEYKEEKGDYYKL